MRLGYVRLDQVGEQKQARVNQEMLAFVSLLLLLPLPLLVEIVVRYSSSNSS